jgi:hypothetical protein
MSQSLLLAEKVDNSPRLFNGVVEARHPWFWRSA